MEHVLEWLAELPTCDIQILVFFQALNGTRCGFVSNPRRTNPVLRTRVHQ